MLSEASGICLVSWKIFTSYTGGSGVWGRLLYCTANEEGKFVEILTKPLWWPFKTETGNDAAFQRADISGRTRKAGSLCVIVWWEPSTNGYLINILESSHLSAGFGSICIFSTLYTCEIFFFILFSSCNSYFFQDHYILLQPTNWKPTDYTQVFFFLHRQQLVYTKVAPKVIPHRSGCMVVW